MLSILVPLLNEAHNVGRLITTLNSQQEIENIHVIFIDNQSDDLTYEALIDKSHTCNFPHTIIQQPIRGKISALRKGVEIAAGLSESYVAILDADSYYKSDDWVSKALQLIKNNRGKKFYLYGQFDYFGFEYLPRFQKAYKAYSEVLNNYIMREFVWFGSGQSVILPLSGFQEYLDFVKEDQQAEDDLKIGLFLLYKGYESIFLEAMVNTSPRKILKNNHQFRKWLFYDRGFYQSKWSQTVPKLDVSQEVSDVSEEDIKLFFERRAYKLVTRNIIPMVEACKNAHTHCQELAALYSWHKKPNINFLDIIQDDLKFEQYIAEIEEKIECRKMLEVFIKKMQDVYTLT